MNHQMLLLLMIGVTLGVLLFVGCGAATSTPVPLTVTPTSVPPTATPTAVPPTATPTTVPPTATPTAVPPIATPTPAVLDGVQLLFAHVPGCPHCAYQRPVIREFEERHPEVEVTWVIYYELNSEQRKLIEGTSGHPVMVFYSGDDTRQLVGETSIAALEEEGEAFRGQVEMAGGSVEKRTIGRKCR